MRKRAKSGYSGRRIVVSFGCIIALLSIAGILKLFIVLLPPAEPRDSNEVHAWTEESVIQPKYADYVRLKCIELDERIRSLKDKPLEKGYISNVQHLSQSEYLASGCEIVALSVAMRAEGFDAGPTEIAEDYLHIGDDVETDYLGSPWENGGGYPYCIVQAANKWLADHDGAGQAIELTGASFDRLRKFVDQGYPVLVWVTTGLVEPYFYSTGWYWPEHCVVLYGYDDKRGIVSVSDSLDGMVERDAEQFESVYEQCGNRAAYIRV